MHFHKKMLSAIASLLLVMDKKKKKASNADMYPGQRQAYMARICLAFTKPFMDENAWTCSSIHGLMN